MNKALNDLIKELETVQQKLLEAETCCAHLNDNQLTLLLNEQSICGKIEQAHQQWLAALDIVDDPIFMHDKEFRIIRCNRAYQRYADLSFDQIIGRPYYELFPKKDGPLKCCESLQNGECSDSDTEEEIEYMGRLFRVRAYCLRNDAGEYLYSVHLLEDITSCRLMEQDLRDSEEKFRNITSSARDAIVMVDENGLFSYWNKGAEKIFGYSMEDVSGRSMFDLVIPNRFHAHATSGFSHYQKKKNGNPIDRTFEFVARKKDGSEFPIEVSISTITLKGKWNGVGIVRDITERKESQQRLNLFRLLLDNTNDAIHVIDPETLQIIDVNETACRDLGYTRDELLSLDVFGADTEATDARIKQLLRNLKRSHFVTYETIHRRKDGSVYPVEVSMTEVTIDKRYAVAVIRDITERKQSEDSLRRANRAHQTLSAVNIALVRTNNETELLKKVTRVIVDTGGYDLAAVDFAQNDIEKNILPVAWSGYKGHHYWVKDLTWEDSELGQTPVGMAIRTGITQICRDIRNPNVSLSTTWRDASLERGYSSNIALPLLNEETTFGALSIYSSESNVFDTEEIKLLEELANDLAYGIMTLRNRVDREQHATVLRNSLVQSIQTIAATLEARDPYTAGHQQRVAKLAIAIARQMGLNDNELQGIELAAIVHDLGKIHIPAEILVKPGRLSEIEYMLIQTHPQEGYNILKEIEFPWPIAEIVLQHHEKIDGSGYPRGLKGDEICLEAKIITVADVVESMSSHRPYRPTLGIDMALDEIIKGKGSSYDPAVVDACMELFGTDDSIVNSLLD